jgi:hypothetical protein
MKNRKLISEVSNGKLTNLVPLSTGGNHKLNPEAAADYEKMVKAAKEDGVEWGITDSYRNLESQIDVAKRKGLYSQGGLAAKPGTSNHGWGSAVDLNFKVGKGNALEWLKNNASKFGFTNIAREPWHWEHLASAKKLSSGSSVTTEPGQTNYYEDEPDVSSNSSSDWRNVGNDINKENDVDDSLFGKFMSKLSLKEEISRIKKLLK